MHYVLEDLQQNGNRIAHVSWRVFLKGNTHVNVFSTTVI